VRRAAWDNDLGAFATQEGAPVPVCDHRVDLGFDAREGCEMTLPRFDGQSDYAAKRFIRIFNSNSIGLT
jgi:hypothetical protein